MTILIWLSPFIYSLLFLLKGGTWWQQSQLLIGVWIGYWLYFLDYLLYFFYAEPETKPVASASITPEADPTQRSETDWVTIGRQKWRQGAYLAFVRWAAAYGPFMTNLITSSFLFLLVYVPLSFYVVTSTGARFAVGLVLGMGLRLSMNLIRDHQNSNLLQLKLFGDQSHRHLQPTHLKWLIGGMVGYLGLLSILVLLWS